jgi:hypothetical protein
VRCAAANLSTRLPNRDPLSNEKVLTFSNCLDILKHRDLIEAVFRDIDSVTHPTTGGTNGRA